MTSIRGKVCGWVVVCKADGHIVTQGVTRKQAVRDAWERNFTREDGEFLAAVAAVVIPAPRRKGGKA